MITKNFKMLIVSLLQASGANTECYLPIKTVSNSTAYIGGKYSNFPYAVSKTVRYSNNSAGIIVGAGNTPATENDYCLESQITSGLSASSVTSTYGLDANGNYYMIMLFTLTNTTGSDITIKEVGYVQAVSSASSEGGTPSSSGSSSVLLDRTVLEQPVTVPANDSAAIKYILKTVLS